MMLTNTRLVSCALAAVFAIVPAISANAACSLPGFWHFFSMSTSGDVVRNCVLKIASSGNMEGSCTSYRTPDVIPEIKSIKGTFSVNSDCNLLGTIAPATGQKIVIKAAHLNGVIGAGIAVQNTTLHHFTLVKK